MADVGSDADFSKLSDQALKDMGNKLFAASQYSQAIQCYTHAIGKQPNISSYFSNRALCYIQLQENSQALLDCRQAVELDPTNIKAHFFAGQAHLGLCQYDEALTHLVHSHNLAQDQHLNYGDEITSVIRLAKRKRFEELDEKRKREEVALQAYLIDLILQDAYRQKNTILNSINPSLAQSEVDRLKSDQQANSSPDVLELSANSSLKQNCDMVVFANEGESLNYPSDSLQCKIEQDNNLSREVQTQLSDLDSLTQKRINELNDLFAQVDERRQKREVPDYLCGRISFELMRDPVITPSGITYDRRSIITHLRKVGHFDPLSRQPLTEDKLIPNLAMKEVVHAFLEENPWAETY